MICWYCYWGWPKSVYEIYQRARDKIGESALHYGPSHVVWEDENFDCAEWCLERFDKHAIDSDYSVFELSIVRQSLEELAQLPLEVRCPEPEDYDGIHPDRFPPPENVEMVKQ